MTRLQAPKYLVKRGEIFYFRMAIPMHLRARFGYDEVKSSLRTEDKLTARRRCRFLANRFEELFMTLALMPELDQEQLQEIARAYFRELLVEGNERIFWIEEMWRNDPADRAEAIEGAGQRETQLRQLHMQGQAAKLFSGSVSAKLSEFGAVKVSKGSDSHGILGGYFVRAQIESARILRAKLQHDYPAIAPVDPLYLGIMDDSLTPLPEHSETSQASGKSLVGLVEKFKKSRQQTWEYKSRLDYDRVLGWFTECIGASRSIQSVTTTDIGHFRDTLLSIPKNYVKVKGQAGLTLKEAIDVMVGSPVLSPRTAEKYLAMARAFLNWCENEGYIDKAPGQKIGIDYKMTEKPRLPYTQDQLNKLFASPIWRGCHSESRRSRPGKFLYRNAYYWLPLVGVYTGMRSGEIIQLRHMDILFSEGVPYFDVNDDHQKKLKTKYSNRRIPVHPRLIEWGFMDFLAKRNTGKPTDRVFKEIQISNTGDPSNAYSKAYSRYLRDIGIKNPQISFHSFRHTIIDALDNASVIEPHKRAMLGHTPSQGAADQYGIGAKVPVLLSAMNKVVYDFESTFEALPAGLSVVKGQ